MNNFSLSNLTGIALAATSNAAITLTIAPAQAAEMSFARPLDAYRNVMLGDTASIGFDVLPADPDQAPDPVYTQLGKQFLSLGIQNLGTQVKFTIKNNVPSNANNNVKKAAVEAVYFDDSNGKDGLPLLGAFQGFSQTGNVNFKQNANPSNIPNALNASPRPFETTWSAQARRPGNPSFLAFTIDPNESLSMLFDLASNHTIDDVFLRMDRADFRIGINVAKLGPNQSLSATYQNVPEPITMLGSGIALGLGSLLKRKAAVKAKKLSNA